MNESEKNIKELNGYCYGRKSDFELCLLERKIKIGNRRSVF
jgi:hypothetical protein